MFFYYRQAQLIFFREGTVVEDRRYASFIRKQFPNVINLHTLMGLNKIFLLYAEKLGIKSMFIVYNFLYIPK